MKMQKCSVMHNNTVKVTGIDPFKTSSVDFDRRPVVLSPREESTNTHIINNTTGDLF